MQGLCLHQEFYTLLDKSPYSVFSVLYDGILPDKTQAFTTAFLRQVMEECLYTANGTQHKSAPDHDFVAWSKDHGIRQKVTRVKLPQTNVKAECVIKTLMAMWHTKHTLIRGRIEELPLPVLSIFIIL